VMDTRTKRQKRIDQIKALRSKTIESGCTEAEMMAFMDKAAAMMDAYEITDEEVQETKDEAAMLHTDPPDLEDPHNIKWRLTRSVAIFCNVELYRMRGETGLMHRPAERCSIRNVAARHACRFCF
jgi:hypothetical protein